MHDFATDGAFQIEQIGNLERVLKDLPFDSRYKVVAGPDIGLEDVGRVQVALQVTGPLRRSTVITGSIAGPIGLSGADVRRVSLEPFVGLVIPGMGIKFGRTSISGGNKIPIGPVTISPFDVDSDGNITGSVDLKSGIDYRGFKIYYGSAGIQFVKKRREFPYDV